MEDLPEVIVGEVSGELADKAALIAAASLVPVAPLAEVVDAPEPITLEEAKVQIRVFGTDDDVYISALISAAREMAEGRLNRTIRQRMRTVSFSDWSEDLVLPKPPFISIEAITYLDEDGQVQTLDDTLYYAAEQDEGAPGRIELAPGAERPSLYRRRRPITVSYLAGYPEGQVPRSIIQWMLLAIGALYNNRESVVTGVSVVELPEDFMNLLIQQYKVYE